MTTASGDFELTMDELRAVAHYVAQSEEDVYPLLPALRVTLPPPHTSARSRRGARWVTPFEQRRAPPASVS